MRFHIVRSKILVDKEYYLIALCYDKPPHIFRGKWLSKNGKFTFGNGCMHPNQMHEFHFNSIRYAIQTVKKYYPELKKSNVFIKK
jgi:hypothetical protein